MDQKNRIRTAYHDCLLLTQRHQRGFTNAFEQAFEAAQAGERQHRRGGGKWRVSVTDAARWHTVKWFLHRHARPENWAAVCTVRDDVRLAYGAADACPKHILKDLRRTYADVLAIEYSEWVSR